MKITKQQLKRIIAEEKQRILSEAMVQGRFGASGLYDQIQEKLEGELLVNVQTQIHNSLTPAQRRLVDLGREAEMMGFEDLMDQVLEWFENYVSAVTSVE